MPCLTQQRIGLNSVSCTTFAAVPGQVQVFARVNGFATNNTLAYTYREPIVDSINPRLYPVDSTNTASRTMTITGRFLTATTPALVNIQVGDRTCTSTSLLTSGGFQCVVPPGVGIQRLLSIFVNGIAAVITNPIDASINYFPPTLSNINPVTGSVEGGYNATLFGLSFGYSSLGGVFTMSLGGVTIQPADIFYRSNNLVTFLVPRGVQLGSVSVSVDVSGQVVQSPDSFFTYTPVISRIHPSSGQVGGNTSLTIVGPMFESPVQVLIGARECTNPQLVNSSTITCTTPQGTGSIIGVRVTSKSFSTPTLNVWSYLSPVLFSVSPQSGAALGGYVVQISGQNLGSLSSVLAQLFLGSAVVPILSRNETYISFIAPGGFGSSLPISLVIQSQRSNSLPWGYEIPIITAAPNPDKSSLTGSSIVTITGRNFGPRPFDQQAYIDGVPCDMTVWISDGTLLCYPSSRSSPADNLPVTVTVSGSTSRQESFAVFSYFSTGILSITPNAGPFTGSFSFQIITENLADSMITVVLTDANGAFVNLQGVQIASNTYFVQVPSLSMQFGDASLLISSSQTTFPVEPFFLYEELVLNSVEPSLVHHQTSTSLTIVGNGFSPRIARQLRLTLVPSLGTTRFSILTSTMLQVVTAASTEPGYYPIRLEILGSRNITSNFLHGYYTDPIPLVSAKYNNDLTGIDVLFSSPTNQGSFNPMSSTCADFFKASTIAAIGSAARCLWSNSRTLVIYPSVYPPLGTPIDIRDDKIVATGKLSQDRIIYPFSSGSVDISFSAQVNPVALASGSTFGQCSPFYLDGLESYGGKATLKYKWEFVYSTPSLVLNDLKSFVDAQTGPVIQVLPTKNEIIAALPTNTRYTFRLTVTNILGLSSSTLVENERTDTDSPTGLIFGSQEISTIASAPVTFTARAIPQICSGDRIIVPSVQWSIASRISGNLADFGMSQTEITQRKINFPANAFRALIDESFILGLVITDKLSDITASYFIKVNIMKTNYALAVIGGNRTTSSLDETIMTASAIDYDEFSGDFAYLWTCSLPNGGGCGFSVQNSSTISIPPNTLSAGTYYFKIVAKKAGRIAESFTFIRVVSTAVPKVEISVSPIGHEIVAENRVYASSTASLQTRPTATFSYSWTVTNDLINMAQDIAISEDGSDIIILENSLVPGVNYEFQVSAVDNLGQEGAGTLWISPNAAPAGGIFECSPMKGLSMNTTFTMSAYYWEDRLEDTPLTYAFYFLSASMATPRLLIKSNVNTVETLLPSGNFTLICEISDRFGSTATRTLSVEVEKVFRVESIEQVVANTASLYSSANDDYYTLLLANVVLQEITSATLVRDNRIDASFYTTALQKMSSYVRLAWERIAKLPDSLESLASILEYFTTNADLLDNELGLPNTIYLTKSAVETLLRLEQEGYSIKDGIYEDLYESVSQFLAKTHLIRNSRVRSDDEVLTSLMLDLLELMSEAESIKMDCGQMARNASKSTYQRYNLNAFPSGNRIYNREGSTFNLSSLPITSSCLFASFGPTNVGNLSHVLWQSGKKGTSRRASAFLYVNTFEKNGTASTAIDFKASNATYEIVFSNAELLSQPEGESYVCVHWQTSNFTSFDETTCEAIELQAGQVSCRCSDSGYVQLFITTPKRQATSALSNDDESFDYTIVILGVVIPVGTLICAGFWFILVGRRRREPKEEDIDDYRNIFTFYNPTNNEWGIYTSNQA